MLNTLHLLLRSVMFCRVVSASAALPRGFRGFTSRVSRFSRSKFLFLITNTKTSAALCICIHIYIYQCTKWCLSLRKKISVYQYAFVLINLSTRVLFYFLPNAILFTVFIFIIYRMYVIIQVFMVKKNKQTFGF